MITVVSGLALRGDLALMALRHHGSLRPNMWEFPGGKLEDGESTSDALRREWREELGIEIRVVAHLGWAPLYVEDAIMLHLYEVEIIGGEEPRPLTSQALTWISPLEAILHRPCTPSTYMFYPRVREVIGSRWAERNK